MQQTQSLKTIVYILKLCNYQFFQASNMQNIPLIEQMFYKSKDKNIASLPSPILRPQSTLVHCVQVININPIGCNCIYQRLAALQTAIFRNNFLTEHINRRLTIIQIVIIVYNSKRRKRKKLNKAFDQLNQFLNNLKVKI